MKLSDMLNNSEEMVEACKKKKKKVLKEEDMVICAKCGEEYSTSEDKCPKCGSIETKAIMKESVETLVETENAAEKAEMDYLLKLSGI